MKTIIARLEAVAAALVLLAIIAVALLVQALNLTWGWSPSSCSTR